MNRDKLSIVLGGILILMHGFSTGAWSEVKDHGAGGPAVDTGATAGRDSVKGNLPDQYKSLEDFLSPEKLKVDGFKAHVVLLGKDAPEAKIIGIRDAGSLLKWVKTFSSYRKGLANCENADDKSAQLLGLMVDQLMAELNHITVAKAPEWKVSEKKILAYIAEIKRFLEEKAKKHVSEKDAADKDAKLFSKSDDAFLAQLVKTAGVLFGVDDKGEIHKLDVDAEIKKEEASLVQQKVDVTAKAAPSEKSSPSDSLIAPPKLPTDTSAAVKPVADVKEIHEEMNKAIDALTKRVGKACKIGEENKDKEAEIEKPKPLITPTPTSAATTPATPTLSPAPILAPTKTATPEITPPDGNNNGGGNNGGNNVGNNGGLNAGNNNGLGDTQQPPPVQQQQQPPFDPNALQQALLQSLQPFNDVLNALQQKRNADDAALQAELEALNRNKDNDDTANLLKALAANQQQPQVQQQPQTPQFQAPQVESPRDNTPPAQPAVADQQAPPPVNPYAMMQQPQPSPQMPYAPDTPRRWDDSDYQPPITPMFPQPDPLAAVRLMFQMQAFQAAQGARAGVAGNVNNMAARFQQVLGGAPRPVYSSPSRLPFGPGAAIGGAAAGYATGIGGVAGTVIGRSSTIPQALLNRAARR